MLCEAYITVAVEYHMSFILHLSYHQEVLWGDPYPLQFTCHIRCHFCHNKLYGNNS